MNKKMRINDKIYDVTTLENYTANKDAYIPQYTAIHIPEAGLVVPVNGRTDTTAGIFIGSGVCYVSEPSNEDRQEYNESNIIDFDNISSIHDMMEKQHIVKSLERDILTSPDNIFEPKIFDDDAPEMKAIKEAVISKHIDLDKYEPRFGSNYNNDKRLFNKNTISLSMTKRLCDALDMDAYLVLKDRSPDVPNPMGKTIEVKLTGGISDEE